MTGYEPIQDPFAMFLVSALIWSSKDMLYTPQYVVNFIIIINEPISKAVAKKKLISLGPCTQIAVVNY